MTASESAKWKLVNSYDPKFSDSSGTLAYRPNNIVSRLYVLIEKPIKLVVNFFKDVYKRLNEPETPYSNSDVLTRQIVEVIEPTLLKYGISPALSDQTGTAIVWCTPSRQLSFKPSDQIDSDYLEDPSNCVDIWIIADPLQKVITFNYVGDLFEFMTNSNIWTKPQPDPISLTTDLSGSLETLIPEVDRFLSTYHNVV